MATSVVPGLIDALVTAARAADTSLIVYDGFGVSADPGTKYLMVGVDDPDARNDTPAAESEQDWANANYTARDESGYVVCAAMGWNGDSDAQAARNTAYSVVATVENMCRTNPSLGLANLLWTSVGGRMQLSQNQSASGAAAVVIFHVNFRARI